MSEDPNLTAIKHRHARLRDLFHRRRVVFQMPAGVRLGQLGLATIMVDELGRLWRVPNSAAEPLTIVWDPVFHANELKPPRGK